MEIRIVNALKDYKKEQKENRKFYGDSYLCYYEKKVINEITKREQTKLIEANADIWITSPPRAFINCEYSRSGSIIITSALGSRSITDTISFFPVNDLPEPETPRINN